MNDSHAVADKVSQSLQHTLVFQKLHPSNIVLGLYSIQQYMVTTCYNSYQSLYNIVEDSNIECILVSVAECPCTGCNIIIILGLFSLSWLICGKLRASTQYCFHNIHLPYHLEENNFQIVCLYTMRDERMIFLTPFSSQISIKYPIFKIYVPCCEW